MTVDDIAQLVGGGLWREGESGTAASFLEKLHEIHAEALDAQAGQSDTQLLGTVLLHGTPDQLLDMGVVGAAQAEKADLFEAALFHHLLDSMQHFLRGSLTDGSTFAVAIEQYPEGGHQCVPGQVTD